MSRRFFRFWHLFASAISANAALKFKIDPRRIIVELGEKIGQIHH